MEVCVLLWWCNNSVKDAVVATLHHSIKDGEKRMAGFLIFFHSCTSLFLNRERLTAIGQLRRQSPHYHQGLMKQIALGALNASQSSVAIWVELRVRMGIQGWLDSLQSAVRNRQETFYQLVCRRQNGTSTAPAMHKAGQRHRSQMLSPRLRWHAITLSPSSRSGYCLLCLGWIMASSPT